MSLHWLFFALISPFLWGLTNVLDGAVRRRFIRHDYVMMWISSMLRLPVLLILIAQFGIEFPRVSGIGMVVAGLLWTAMFVPYLRALDVEETSRVTLFLQMISIFALILGYFILGEALIGRQAFAFILIFIGGSLAALRRLEGRWSFSRAFWLILLASFFWALSDVMFKFLSEDFSSFMNAFTLFLGGSFLTGPLMLLFPKWRRAILSLQWSKIPARAWAMNFTSVFVGILGSLTFAYALTLGKVSLTSVLVETQPLFVFLFSLLLSRWIAEVDPEEVGGQALLVKGLSFAMIAVGLLLLYYAGP